MIKLLIVTTVYNTCRAFLLPFAVHFRSKGWRVDAMARGVTKCECCGKAFDHLWEVEWSRNPLDPLNQLQGFRCIQKLVSQQRYDIVHVHTPIAAFVTRYALRHMRLSGKPKVIYTAHGFHFHTDGNWYRNAVFRNLEKVAGRWTDYLVVINREDEEAALRYQIVPPERLFYMPGIGVDTKQFNPDAVPDYKVEQVRRELALSKDDKLFLMIAGFNKGKRHKDLIRAFAKLNRNNTHLAFAGEGPLMNSIMQQASELGIQHRVHFLGYRRDIPALIKSSVATILPSEREGLPRSVMETMCFGVPVIGTDIRGIRDLLGDGAGLMFKVGDVNDLSNIMAWVLDNPERASEIGKRGREKIVNYDLQRIIAMHEDLYAKALALMKIAN